MNKKRGSIPYWLASILIAVAVLVILMIISFLLKGTLFSIIDKIKKVIFG